MEAGPLCQCVTGPRHVRSMLQPIYHHRHRPSGTQTSVLGTGTFLGVRDVKSLSPVHHIHFPVNTNRIPGVGTE